MHKFKTTDWLTVLLVITCVIGVIYMAHYFQFIANNGRLPHGSGEVWNWILGL